LDREQEIAKEALKTGDKVSTMSATSRHILSRMLSCWAGRPVLIEQRRALTALRQRKFQEGLLTKTDGQLQTLQELVRISFRAIVAQCMADWYNR
jgi:charged multivesicular body protein 6